MGRLRCALATLVAGVVLVACSDDDAEPRVSDPTPSAATASAGATAGTSPSSPASSDPEEAASHWIAAQNEALATGSTQQLHALSAPGCRGCEEFATPIEQVFEAGGSYEGGTWKLISTHIESERADAAALTAAVRIAAGTTIPAAGADPVRYDEQSHLMKFELVREAGAWLFAVIAFVS
jgi:hypothetical protein